MSTPGEAPVTLVTGANKGIGYSTAEQLAQLGHQVLLGARHPERGEAAARALREAGGSATYLPLDITSDEQVYAAARWIAARFGRLDALVNNAAIKLEFHPAPPSRCELDVVRRTLDTNVVGTIRVIQAMLPLLRRAPAGRIVNVSSGLGSLTLATTPGSKYRDRPLLSYNVAKAALNSVTVQFANELRDTAVKVNAVDPGFTNTDMTKNSGSRTPTQAAAAIVRLATTGPDGPTAGYFDEGGSIPW
ncbi:MAG: SDR family NAD(P)-dependent oxidoreductase [Acidobacteriota bacterium]|nr:SDR family NAD(P)-dependent oxidoreductase [Acidobacteriota bacterium]